MSDLQAIAQQAIDRAKKSGATAADAMIREDNSFSVTVRIGEVETLKEAISRSLMVRVFVGKRTATSHTSDLTPTVVDRLVDETVEMVVRTLEAQTADSWSHPYSAVGAESVNDRFTMFLRCAAHFQHHLGQMIYLSNEHLK